MSAPHPHSRPTFGIRNVCALLLEGVDRLQRFANPCAAIQRVVLVAFATSFLATIVDKLK